MLAKAIVAGLVTAFLVGALMVVPTFAGKWEGKPGFGYGYRPGWGWGDPNHEHTGPPGLVDDLKPGKGAGRCGVGEP